MIRLYADLHLDGDHKWKVESYKRSKDAPSFVTLEYEGHLTLYIEDRKSLEALRVAVASVDPSKLKEDAS